MKTSFLILLATLTFTITNAQKKIETVKIQTSAVCDMCKETIEKQLAFTEGVTAVELNVETAIVTVSYKTSRTNLDAIRESINSVGYDADDHKAEHSAYEKLHHCCKKDAH